MAIVLRRRATTAIVATIRATIPSDGSLRQLAAVTMPRLPAANGSGCLRPFASVTTPRLPAAATMPSTLRLSSATTTTRYPFTIAAPLRRIHQAPASEVLEARIQRLEVDLDNKIIALRVELQKGSAEVCQKVEKGFAEAHDTLRKAHLDAYACYLEGQASQDVRITNLSELITAESRRSLQRAATSSAESAKNLVQIGKVSWRVVVTIVAGAASAGFATAQLLRADTTTHQVQIADDRFRAKSAELHEDFSNRLDETVQRAVQGAVAKEAARKSNATDEVLQTFNSRLDDFFDGLDSRIEKAVEVALAKQALKKQSVGDSAGGGTSIN